ncbi:alpha-hydroxy acid oxidase [Ancylobacter vacuolatus]|uniref:L-lactate dehydrogenase (Cytochrome) n=1 Tax=Ancylobacter vacuolatus TaxID=223389 RepID=A0ABU0DEB6_9HYPH|nr:alpha-hydroxy acid oxidase [Ancylobacter vacuolatus]MDQ0346737.1 L-lactate dehydrogenase (cytochrome) [Ancylobacter vacuolatus]
MNPPAGALSRSAQRRQAAREARYPCVADLVEGARARLPSFVMATVEAGCGDNAVVRRNRAAFDDIALLPRHGFGRCEPSLSVSLFGRDYASPFGIAPMGLGALVRPKLEESLARAAQAANIPYVLSTAASAGLETIGRIAPDVLWFQLFGLPHNDHRCTFDLMRRAGELGVQTLVLTLDTPVRAHRPQDVRNRLAVPFRPGPAALLQMLGRPRWLADMLRAGPPGCESLRPYVDGPATPADLVRFAATAIEGGFSWALVRRIRDRWPGRLVVKGVLHPADAREARAVGADGILVSNHGGRTFDAAPASLDMLPKVRAAGGDGAVMVDSGVRSGLDVVRALACGADMAFLGRPFLYAVAALGEEGGDFLIRLLREDVRRTLCQIGVSTCADLGKVETRSMRAGGAAHQP